MAAAQFGGHAWGWDIDYLTLHARTKPTRHSQVSPGVHCCLIYQLYSQRPLNRDLTKWILCLEVELYFNLVLCILFEYFGRNLLKLYIDFFFLFAFALACYVILMCTCTYINKISLLINFGLSLGFYFFGIWDLQ